MKIYLTILMILGGLGAVSGQPVGGSGIKFKELRHVDDSTYVVLTDGIGFDTITLSSILSSPSAVCDSFDSDRPIARVPQVGDNIGGSTVCDWLEYWYMPGYQKPTISLNYLSPAMIEVGTSHSYTLSGATQNPCSFTLSNGSVDGNGFGAATSYSIPITYLPTTNVKKQFKAQQDWDDATSTCDAGTPHTGTAYAYRYVRSVYPVLYGMSATVYDNTNNPPYSMFGKKLVVENNNSTTGLTMTGTNEYIYIAIPKSWSDTQVTTIIDHNGFDVTPSFTAYDVTITSTGLSSNWTKDYKLYKLNNLTTANGFDYTYNK